MIEFIQKLDLGIFLYFVSFAGKNPEVDYLIVYFGRFIPYFFLVFLLGMAVAGFFPKYRGSGGAWVKALLAAGFSALIAQYGIVVLVRLLFDRMRPFEVLQFTSIIKHDAGGSFPSGHAAVAFAMVAVLWFRGYKKLSVVFFVFSVIMGVARITGGVHWPSDIIGGFISGVIAAWVVQKTASIMDFTIRRS